MGNAGHFEPDFCLRGVWGSGGFRRVRSCVRSRKLLTRASGTRLASRLRRNKFWEKCASRADLDFGSRGRDWIFGRRGRDSDFLGLGGSTLEMKFFVENQYFL